MPATPAYGWPIPAPSDPDNVPGDLQRLALAIESSLDRPWWRAYPTAGQSVGPDGWSQVVLAGEDDPFGVVSGSAFTAPYTGRARISWSVSVVLSGAAPGAVNLQSSLYLNGVETQRGTAYTSSSAPSLQAFATSGSVILPVSAGHVVTLWAYTSAPGTAKTIQGPGTYMMGDYLNPRPAT